ncbi:MAG: Spy/CpxP family protein refolding chaperone [Rhodoferax sp.]
MFHFRKHHFRRAAFGLLGAGLVLGSLTACGHRYSHEPLAQMSPEAYAQKRDKLVERVADHLDLDAVQKGKLTTLADALMEQRKALVGATTDPRAELGALIAGDKFNAERAQALINEKASAVQDKSPQVVAALAEFYNSLKPEQQQKVRDRLEGRHRWFHWG